jgi:hypothetical protein
VGKESIGVLVEKLQIIGEDSTYDVSSGLDQEKGEAWSGTFGAETQALDSSAPSVSTAAESYTIQIGGNTISGLQFGEKYTVNGAEFVVTKDQMKGGGK